MEDLEKDNSKLVNIIIFVLIVLVVLIVAGALIISNRQLATIKTAAGDAKEELAEKDPNIIESRGDLVSGFPDFPLYPGAEIEESSKRKQPINSNRDLRAVFTTPTKSVPVVMSWYLQELDKQGWTVERPNDPRAQGEQVAQIAKDDLVGYLAVEDEAGSVEIVVDLKRTNN